jgi:hypothetical protein
MAGQLELMEVLQVNDTKIPHAEHLVHSMSFLGVLYRIN